MAGPGPKRPAKRRSTTLRSIGGFAAALAVLIVVWEATKWLAGDPWRYESFLGTGIVIDHTPPFRLSIASDINLPHVWDVVGAFGEADAAGRTGLETLLGAALFTLRGANSVNSN